MDALSSGLMCKKEEIWGFEQVLRAQLWWLGDLIGRQPLMTFGPAILVGVTRTWTTYTSIVEDFVMDTIFPDNCGPFDHNNAPAHRTKKWFRNGLDQSNMPPKSPDLCPVDHLWEVAGKHFYPGRSHFSNYQTSCQHFSVGYHSTPLGG